MTEAFNAVYDRIFLRDSYRLAVDLEIEPQSNLSISVVEISSQLKSLRIEGQLNCTFIVVGP